MRIVIDQVFTEDTLNPQILFTTASFFVIFPLLKPSFAPVEELSFFLRECLSLKIITVGSCHPHFIFSPIRKEKKIFICYTWMGSWSLCFSPVQPWRSCMQYCGRLFSCSMKVIVVSQFGWACQKKRH